MATTQRSLLMLWGVLVLGATIVPLTSAQHACSAQRHCLNAGTCSQGTCLCPAGFQGRRCQTATASTTCSPVACAVHCPTGFMVDANGCRICKCNAPNTTAPNTTAPATKQGFCPVVKQSGSTCPSTCQSDSQCPGTKKCCPSTCVGMRCACSPLTCRLVCPAGFLKGKDGCNICSCATPSTTQPPSKATPTMSPTTSYQTTRYLSLCERTQQQVGTPPPRRGRRAAKPVGSYYPACENDGRFERVQCPSSGPVAKLSDCFCVNQQTGVPLRNYRVIQQGVEKSCVMTTPSTTLPSPTTKAPVTCPPVSCSVHCQTGFQHNANGCRICKCNPVVTTKTSMTIPPPTVTTPAGCPLPNKTIIPVGTTYNMGPCTRCVCRTAGRNPACIVIDCPRPNCPAGYKTITRNGACCPTCVKVNGTVPPTHMAKTTHMLRTTRMHNGTHMPRTTPMVKTTHMPRTTHVHTGTHMPRTTPMVKTTHMPRTTRVHTGTHMPRTTRMHNGTHMPKTTLMPRTTPMVKTTHMPRTTRVHTGTHMPRTTPMVKTTHMGRTTRVHTGTHMPSTSTAPCPQASCLPCRYGYVFHNGCQTCYCKQSTAATVAPTKCPSLPCPLCKNGYIFKNGCQTCQCITLPTTGKQSTTAGVAPTVCPPLAPCPPCLNGFVIKNGCQTCQCKTQATTGAATTTSAVPVIRLRTAFELKSAQSTVAMFNTAGFSKNFKLYLNQWLQSNYKLVASNIQELDVALTQSNTRVLVTFDLMSDIVMAEGDIRYTRALIEGQAANGTVSLPYYYGGAEYEFSMLAVGSGGGKSPSNNNNGGSSGGISTTTLVAVAVGSGVALAAIIVMLIVLVKVVCHLKANVLLWPMIFGRWSHKTRGSRSPPPYMSDSPAQATYTQTAGVSINSCSPNFDEPLYESDTRKLVQD